MVTVPRSSRSCGGTGVPGAVRRCLGAMVELCPGSSPPSGLLHVRGVLCVVPLRGFRVLCPFRLLNMEDRPNSDIFVLSSLCGTWDKDPRAEVARICACGLRGSAASRRWQWGTPGTRSQCGRRQVLEPPLRREFLVTRAV